MVCSSCGTENRAGRKFCSNCGALVMAACPACGAANEPGDRFCGECGSEMPSTEGVPTASAPAPTTRRPVAERRLVSVLFADLVGFTSLSESRDAEDVRELLSEYFATARRIIARYGGTVEKFIGDAVMAVWGAPVAQEDDAERAVRAGLDLVGAVAALGEDLHAPGLAVRAGVATGETAVTLGAEGQGMVAGDLVNTASRVQSAANPGAVLVTEATRRATEAAIAYEDAGLHELKGKTEPIKLSQAVRVIALVGGQLRSAGLESPFVGRDREFRLLKDLFHASAEDRKAHLLSVTGIGGIGKSRLSWEFFKYIDGLADNAWWHRGRCLSYGDGVTYWALAEMVRMRARIVEEEEPEQAAAKLQSSLLDIVPDEDERRFVEPRIAHLLGLADLSLPTREDLFAGWRLFFEKMSERWPVVMVFEDLQWADESLLDFIEHLLEWSRNHPLFVVTLARPDLLEHRPTWGAGRHGSTSLSLEPLPDEAMRELLRGMVPGLPDELVERIGSRAEGVPLYAVETVRMLLDRGLLRRDGDRFEPTSPIDELAVPETLQALIAARLDGLPPEERALLQDASVLGKTFTVAGLATVAGRAEDELVPLLTSLVRKEMLNLHTDVRSPERGQYGFLQSLVQKVAYDTLSRRDRKAKHLAAADHLERNWAGDEDEIVEVLAAHLLEGYRLAPEDPDADAIRDRARATLTRAGTRARSLAAMRLAHGYFFRAAELASDPSERATLIEQAALSAFDAGEKAEPVLSLLEEARALFEDAREAPASARVLARIGNTLWLSDRPAEAVERMTEALDVLTEQEPDHGLALLAATLGKILMFQGQDVQAMPRIEKALDVAEALWLPDVLSDALNTKGLLVGLLGRSEEELAMLKRSLELALENDLVGEAARAYNNLAFSMSARDRLDDSEAYSVSGIELAQRFGLGPQLAFFRGSLADTWFVQGRWEEIDELGREMEASGDEPRFYGGPEVTAAAVIGVAVERGDLDRADRVLERFVGDPEIGDVQTSAHRHHMHAYVRLAHGDHRAALESARRTLEPIETLGVRHDLVKRAVPVAFEAAVAVGDLAAAREVVSIFTDATAPLSPLERAFVDRYRARLSALEGSHEGVAQAFKSAAGLLRELGTPFYLAGTLLDHGEWLVGQGRTDEAHPLLADAREIFERLGARPYVKRIETMSSDLARA